MEKKTAHCLVLAYPSQGHINPLLQFSKVLQHEGVKVTLVSTFYYFNNTLKKLPNSNNISLETISDGFDNGKFGEAKDVFRVYLDTFWKVGPQTLFELIEKFGRSNNPIDCLIYDPFMPWAIEVAKKCGIIGVPFFTQNLAVNSIYYHVHLGKLSVPLSEEEILLPALPKLQHSDMPTFFFDNLEDSTIFNFVVDQFSTLDKADWIFCNSLYELDTEVADWTMSIWPKFRTIGPSIPSKFLDNRIKDDEDYGATQFTSVECIEWLNDKPKGSVVYVSFGSLVPLSEEQLEEIAYALRDSGNYFLWVVRASEETKLPKDFEKKTQKGLVVTWCSQLKVLAHEAIVCFVTHCGWNSTLESLSLGVPIIAVPQWSDQCTNAKYIADIWKMGIRALVDDKKIVRREVLKDCISEIMESEKGNDIKRNAMQWRNLIVGAVGEGGSSRQNILEFVNSLSNSES